MKAPLILHSLECPNSFFEYSAMSFSVVARVIFRFFLFVFVINFAVFVLFAVWVLSPPFLVGLDIEIVVVTVRLFFLRAEVVVVAVLAALNVAVRGRFTLFVILDDSVQVGVELFALSGGLLDFFVVGSLWRRFNLFLDWLVWGSVWFLSLWVGWLFDFFGLFVAHGSVHSN